MRLELATITKAIVKAAVGAITGYREVIKLTIEPRTARPNHNDLAVGLHNNIVPLSGGVVKRNRHAAFVAKRLVKAAVGVEPRHEERSRDIVVDERASYDLAVRLNGDGAQLIAARIEGSDHLAADAEGVIEAAVSVVAPRAE